MSQYTLDVDMDDMAEHVVNAVLYKRENKIVPYDNPDLIHIYRSPILDTITDVVIKDQRLDQSYRLYVRSMFFSNIRILISELAQLDPEAYTVDILKLLVKNHGTTFHPVVMEQFLFQIFPFNRNSMDLLAKAFVALNGLTIRRGTDSAWAIELYSRIPMETMPDIVSWSRTWSPRDVMQLLMDVVAVMSPIDEAENIIMHEEFPNLLDHFAKCKVIVDPALLGTHYRKGYNILPDTAENALAALTAKMSMPDLLSLTYQNIRDYICPIISGFSGEAVSYADAPAELMQATNRVAKAVLTIYTTPTAHYSIADMRDAYADDWLTTLDANALYNCIWDAYHSVEKD